jgi:hypothetical protein
MKKIILALPVLFVSLTMTTCTNEIVRNLWPTMYEYEYTKVPVHSSRNPADHVYLPTALLKDGVKIAWWGEGTAAYIPDDLGFKPFTVGVCKSGLADFRPLTFCDTVSLQNSVTEYYPLSDLAKFEPTNTQNAYTWHIQGAVDNPTFRECFSSVGKITKLPKSFTMQR